MAHRTSAVEKLGANRRLKVAMLIPDDRDEFRHVTPPGPTPVFGPAPQALLEGFQAFPDSIELHIVSCTHDHLAAPAQLAENVFYHSVVVPTWGWRSLYMGCVWAIRRCLDHIQPDLVHGQGTERYCALAAAYSGYPNIVTILGNMRAVARKLGAPWNSFHGWTARMESLALRKTDGILCNSAYTEAQVHSLAKRTWLIPNALRSGFFEPVHTLQMIRSIPRLLNIGSVVPYKRQLELLSWAEQLHRNGQRFTIDFIGNAGNDAYSQAFLRAIASAESAGYARFLGRRNGGALIQELDTADAMIHVPTEESFGLVAAEALARNLKLFASRTGGLVDIASGTEGAELFDINDWEGLSSSVTSWCSIRVPRPTSAAATMQTRYHPRVVAVAHLELYRALLHAQ